MDTFLTLVLTLVIALGGIATGIGAIWTAMLARRQISEQRRFLEEQNERARLTLEYDLITRLGDRFDGPYLLSRRRAAAKYLLDNAFLEEDTKMVEVPSLNRAAIDVCGIFEVVGELLRLGVLSIQSVWNRFGVSGTAYWYLCKPGIEKLRGEWEDPTLYEQFEYLSGMLAEIDHQRGIGPPTPEQVRQIMEAEVAIGDEEPPATTESEGI